MTKRVLAFGAVLAVLASALITILAIVDVITMDRFRESLPRLLGVIVVATVAVLLILKIGPLAKK